MADATTGLYALDENQRWKLLIDSMADYAIFMLDADGYVASWNIGAENAKKYTAEEIIGQHFSVFYTQADRDAGVPQQALEMAEREGRAEMEGWRVRKDGTCFWASVLIDPIRSDDGKLIGFAKVTRDITERVTTRRELMESERRFRLFVQSVTDYAIIMLDAGGYIANWNHGAQRITGYSEGEIYGRHVSCFYTDDDQRQGVPQHALETVRTTGKYNAEGWRQRKDGSRFFAHVQISPIHDAGDTLIGFAIITRDITEQRKTEQDLRQAREALFQAQKMEAIGQLTGGIAHDFNNLLTVIINSLDFLSRKPLSEREKRYLDNARVAASRGATLTRQLLAFARRQTLAPRLYDINRLIAEFQNVLGGAVGAPVHLQLDLEEGVPPVNLDSAQFESVLLNLSVNARDAMPDGGTILITTSAVSFDKPYPGTVEPLPPGCYVAVTVTDQGTGIPPELCERIFDPFFTTKAVGKGTGLGLSQVYGFVAQSGGGVEIVSSDATGTSLRLYLPARHDAVAAPFAEEAKVASISPGIEVLVVEDEDLVRTSAIAILESLGCTVFSVANAAGAMTELAHNPQIDILFSDIVLRAGENGCRLAERVQSAYPAVKIILTSGHPGSQANLPSGVVFVPKPYASDDIARALAGLGFAQWSETEER